MDVECSANSISRKKSEDELSIASSVVETRKNKKNGKSF